MIWLLLLLIILMMSYWLIQRQQKKKFEKLKQKLVDSWSHPKQNEYFDFEIIARYFQKTPNKSGAFHVISDRTAYDLDLDELFKFIDRTHSKIGQQFLYYKIRSIENKDSLKDFDALTRFFGTHPSIRLKFQLALSNLNSERAYDLEKLIHDTTIEKPPYHKFLIPLAITALFSIIMALFYPAFILLLIPVFSINLIFHLKNKYHINYYLSGVLQLNKALQVSKYLASFSDIKKYFKNLEFINRVNDISFKTKFIGFEQNLVNEFAIIFWFIAETIKIMFNVEAIIFYSFIDDIVNKNQDIDKMFQFIGQIDAAISTASVLDGDSLTCPPEFNEKGIVTVHEIIHPLIKNCVSNTIELHQKSLLLTGSNMSGKTTFIRTMALNAILAQTLYFAFAEKFEIPFYKIYSSVRISDDLTEDTSYYLKEVLTIKQLIKASEQSNPCLFVLDEIFKGTNTLERISGGKAILSYLNRKDHLVLVSTHDIELTDLLQDQGYDLYHFAEKIENNQLIFDHKLKKGKLTTRNAIKILELYDYPDSIITDAQNTLQVFLKSDN